MKTVGNITESHTEHVSIYTTYILHLGNNFSCDNQGGLGKNESTHLQQFYESLIVGRAMTKVLKHRSKNRKISVQEASRCMMCLTRLDFELYRGGENTAGQKYCRNSILHP